MRFAVARRCAAPLRGQRRRLVHVSSRELLQRSMCFALSNKDMEAVVDCVRVAKKLQAAPTRDLAPELWEVDTAVRLPVLSEEGAEVPLFQCTLFRCVAAYTGWHVAFEAPEPDRFALDEGGCVVARSTKYAATPEPTCLAGFGLVEGMYKRAEREAVRGLRLDPRPEARDLVVGDDALESTLLEFFSRVAKVEAAMSDWGVLSRALAETGGGPGGMDENTTKERLLTSATQMLDRHRDYWILKTTDPSGRAVAIQSDGWLFLFTSPDVALRHALDARAQNDAVPEMAPHRFPSTQVRDHAKTAGDQLAGVWINPPATPPPNATLAGVKLSAAQLADWYGLVATYGAKLPPGW